MLNGRTIESFKEFKSIFYNQISEIYGTHDWIADRSLILLYEFYPNDNLISSIYNNCNNMRIYYLYGTELPDHFENPSKSINIETDLGTRLTEEDFYNNHSIIMFPNGRISKFRNYLFKSAKFIIEKYKENLISRKDIQLTALFLGFISHLIADACFVHHLYENPDRSVLQQARGEILKRTRNSPEDVLWPDSISITNYDLARNEFNGQINSLENILLYCITHTYFGKPHKNGSFQNLKIPDCNWFSDIKIKDIKKENCKALYTMWWNAIEAHLNLAIFYTAAAINSFRPVNMKI